MVSSGPLLTSMDEVPEPRHKPTYVTEGEARERACPNSSNRSMSCVGETCMAWRWYDPPLKHPEQRRGFCGLAGRP